MSYFAKNISISISEKLHLDYEQINQKLKIGERVPLFQVLADLFIGDHSVCICQFQGILNVNDLASFANL